jgi:DNA (cytosine-5)-methyltransferase 1
VNPSLNVISVCSGIGTDAVAWHPLGWKHLCFAEIEKFPSAVLAHHWPAVINRGDFTKIGDEYRGSADLLVGGTPCQSFSIAGLRYKAIGNGMAMPVVRWIGQRIALVESGAS